MSWILTPLDASLFGTLRQPAKGYEPFTESDPDALRLLLRRGDVRLIEGNSHLSGVIKYLTHSTWSHAALYVGPIRGETIVDSEPHVLAGGRYRPRCCFSPAVKILYNSTRAYVVRFGLTSEDLRESVRVCGHTASASTTTSKISIDLLRVSGAAPDPAALETADDSARIGQLLPRLICSTLIAGAFQSIRYPILPKVTQLKVKPQGAKSWQSDNRRCICRATLTFRLISQSSSQPSKWVSITNNCTGPTYRPCQRGTSWTKRVPMINR